MEVILIQFANHQSFLGIERELVTPPLTDGTILPGVTRDSIIQLARTWNEFSVNERAIDMSEVIEAQQEGRLLEMFGSGTAAVISPIRRIYYQGRDWEISLDPIDPACQAGPLARRLWEAITMIQYGEEENSFCQKKRHMPSQPSYTIDEALESVGFGRFQWHLLILSGVGFFATTVELISVSLLRIPLLTAFPTTTNKQFGWLTSATFLGEMIGGLGWGWLGDRMGRKMAFRGTAFLAAVAGCLAAWAPCFYSFGLARFFLGLAIGGSLAIDFVYFVEFVPTTARGFRTTFIVLLGIMAFFYTALVGWLTLSISWRAYVLSCGIPYVILFIGRCFWRWESPRFLLTRGRPIEARVVLGEMARRNGRALPIGELHFPVKGTIDGKKSTSPTPLMGGLKAIRESAMVGPTIAASAVFFFQTFGYYALTIWFRSFAALKSLSNLDPLQVLVVIGMSELPGLALAVLLIERAGRRAVLLVSFAGAALCSALLLVVNSKESFLAVFSATYFFIVGAWTAIYVVTPELFPTTCRATSFAIAGAVGKVGGMISPIIFGILWDNSGTTVWMAVAIVVGAFSLAAITAAMLMMETSGRNLVDH